MKRILMLGAGKVGSLIACLLSETGDYRLYIGESDGDAIRRAEELASPNMTVQALDAVRGLFMAGLKRRSRDQNRRRSSVLFQNPDPSPAR